MAQTTRNKSNVHISWGTFYTLKINQMLSCEVMISNITFPFAHAKDVAPSMELKT
jgi:hypothetical protein